MSSNKKNKPKLIVITGPTASGKTSLAVKLASDINGEIISADSRQIYKGMDIGTGKDLNEYTLNNKKINYHLIDILNPNQDYSVYNFQKDFIGIYRQMVKNNVVPIVCGGTGLYIESILLDYDLSKKPPPNKELRDKLEKHDKKELLNIIKSLAPLNQIEKMLLSTKKQIIRNIEILKSDKSQKGIPFDPMKDDAIVIALNIDRELLREKIKKRLVERVNNGMIQEVEKLLRDGLPMERLDYFGLEYKHVGQYLRKETEKEEMIQNLTTAIRKFAKRQRTWFRRMEKRGIKIHWIPYNNYNALYDIIDNGS